MASILIFTIQGHKYFLVKGMLSEKNWIMWEVKGGEIYPNPPTWCQFTNLFLACKNQAWLEGEMDVVGICLQVGKIST